MRPVFSLRQIVDEGLDVWTLTEAIKASQEEIYYFFASKSFHVKKKKKKLLDYINELLFGQLALTGLFSYLHSPALVEDISVPERLERV